MVNHKPVINIYVNSPYDGVLQETQAGVEEEGVLYEINVEESNNAAELARKAAVNSQLETGIGIFEGDVCVSISKLSGNEPLFKIDGAVPEMARNAGCNAARFVKGVPFKLMDKQVVK